MKTLNLSQGADGEQCVEPDADLTEAIALMESHHVAQIPVVFEGAVRDMISMAELLATVAHRFDQASTSAKVFATTSSLRFGRKAGRQELSLTSW
ncbi:putative transcriptional regulator [Nitrobacter vulgaris]|uniref:CBS domain-containing protein n=1 Tax=Nitrobacter vulgaris TaxID=29421 RepID=UPI0028634CCC|nr:CBS domain-containing protein [Nitrobacter vulgaris]MDR6305213.1 putative transcriptional regulator [Nitrobacter vulgaris]